MRAIILAAGKGERLKPYTSDRPKCLVELAGRTLLDYQVEALAAAGIHALEHHVARLADDHANATRLAAGLRELGFQVEPEPQTNMVFFHVDDEMTFLRATRERELKIDPIRAHTFRAVTHLDISADDVEDALERIGQVV